MFETAFVTACKEGAADNDAFDSCLIGNELVLGGGATAFGVNVATSSVLTLARDVVLSAVAGVVVAQLLLMGTVSGLGGFFFLLIFLLVGAFDVHF